MKIKLEEGLDVTELLNILKYEAPIPAQLNGQVKGMFPSIIPQPDECRLQNLTKDIEIYRKDDIEFVGTEKVDGSAMTCILSNDEFEVCSKGLNLKEFDVTAGVKASKTTNTFWQVARANDIEQKMRFYCEKKGIKELAIYGELLGEGIQKNKYKLKGHDVYLFNAYNMDTNQYLDWEEFQELITITGLKQVPILLPSFKLNQWSIDDLLLLTEGKSDLNPNINREGIVFKSKAKVNTIGNSFEKISFKVINNKFLLKYGDE